MDELRPARIGLRAASSAANLAEAQAGFMNAVYRYMALGLAASGLTALLVASSPTALRAVAQNRWLFVLAELGLVFVLSAMVEKLTPAVASALFLGYSVLSGVTLAMLFAVYTRGSIASTFFVAAGTFGAMSVYGLRTRRSLASWGSFLVMGLIGVVIATLVNLFLQSPALYWISTYAGVLVFVGLAAYDTQKISQYALVAESDEERQKLAINGALTLYLDFVNLFLMLLRLLGRRR